MNKYEVKGITYDTTGADLLPEEGISLDREMIVYCDSEDEVADVISDSTGFLVESIESIEIIKEL